MRRVAPRLVDDLVRGADHGLAADDERARAVGVKALVRDLGVTVQDLDVLEGDTQPVGDDLAEGRLVPLTVRAHADDDLDLARREHAHARVLPATRAVVEAAEDTAGRETAHLGEGRDADAQLHGVLGLAPTTLLLAQLVVAEHLLGQVRGGLVVAGVVLETGNGGEGELLVGDPVALAHHERVLTELVCQLVHDPLDAEGGLGATGTPVGIGPGLVGEDRLHREVVGRELVDGVEHEGAQDGNAAADEGDVGAEVREQVDLEPGDLALLVGGERQPLPLVTAVVGRHERLRAGLGVLDGPAQLAGHPPGQPLLRRHLQLAAEAAADVRGDDPDLRLRDAGRGREREAHDVRDLGRRPHRQLLAGRVDDDGARLHEGGDESLLAVLALDDDAVLACGGNGLLDVTPGAGLGGVEGPQGRLVGAEVGMREDGVLRRLLEVEGGGQLLVVDVDQLSGVARLRGAAGDDEGDDLPGEGHPVGRHRRVHRSHLVRTDRPRVDEDADRFVEVGAGVDGDDIGRADRLARIDGRDPGVREGAADHRHVQHARQHDVVGPAGATGDEPLVLLATAVAADLGGGGPLGDLRGHDAPPAAPAEAAAEALAAVCTARTMLW